MLFNSLHFLIFFLVVFGLTSLLRDKVRARNAVLLVAGYYFYAWWNWRFCFLLAFTTLFDFFCGWMLYVPVDVLALHADRSLNRSGKALEDASHEPLRRTARDKWFVAASMAVNLIILGFFKYYNFFAQSTADFLTHLGLQAHLPVLNVVLPLGISFYTFQSMNYVIDVYRGELEAERSLLNFALFVSFFPHLVAGPILRATSLMPQVKRPSDIRWEKICIGFYLFVWGLFKKVVIADSVSGIADDVFANFTGTVSKAHSATTLAGGGTALLGIYAFAIQIYCDFSGYTDMARGCAKILGFELPHNFNLPYFAANASDFWRRWHISLSTWLRDYLYIPLGGNRKGTVRTYVNLMITMLLGGLWHGAAWTFVLWGAYHGTLLCIHHGLRGWLKRNFTPQNVVIAIAWLWIRIFIFFHITCFGWLLFRATSLQQVVRMTKAVFSTLPDIELDRDEKHALFACALVLVVVQLYQAWSGEKLVAWRLPIPVRAVVYAAVFLGIIIFGGVGGKTFIYFAF